MSACHRRQAVARIRRSECGFCTTRNRSKAQLSPEAPDAPCVTVPHKEVICFVEVYFYILGDG
jgi:hypothetical protein